MGKFNQNFLNCNRVTTQLRKMDSIIPENNNNELVVRTQFSMLDRSLQSLRN